MEELIVVGLTILGISFLLISFYRTNKVRKLLIINYYEANRWYSVLLLLFFFVVGYLGLIGFVTGYFELPISLELTVALVYFFGAIFTLVTTAVVRSMLHSILGGEISKTEAIQLFRKYTGIENGKIQDFDKLYQFDCEFCDNKVRYRITDIVRSNLVALDKGIAVEDIFGTKSYIFRPTHICKKGRREYQVVHDNELEIRSIEESRIIFGGKL